MADGNNENIVHVEAIEGLIGQAQEHLAALVMDTLEQRISVAYTEIALYELFELGDRKHFGLRMAFE